MFTTDAAPRRPSTIAMAVAVNRRAWSRIIAEIKAGYLAVERRTLSDYKLGLMVGLDHSSIEHLQKHADAQPRHYEGELLLAVHQQYAPASRCGTAPIVHRPGPST